MPNNEREELLNRILEDDSDLEKIGSDDDYDDDYDDFDEDQIEKIARYNIQIGRLRARAFASELRKEASQFFEDLGLTPDLVQASLQKEAAGNGVPGSYPMSDILSQVLSFIFKKIHPHMMINNYKPGTSGTQGLQVDPDSHPVGKENTEIADHRRTSNVTPPSNPFGLRKKKRK